MTTAPMQPKPIRAARTHSAHSGATQKSSFLSLLSTVAHSGLRLDCLAISTFPISTLPLVNRQAVYQRHIRRNASKCQLAVARHLGCQNQGQAGNSPATSTLARRPSGRQLVCPCLRRKCADPHHGSDKPSPHRRHGTCRRRHSFSIFRNLSVHSVD